VKIRTRDKDGPKKKLGTEFSKPSNRESRAQQSTGGPVGGEIDLLGMDGGSGTDSQGATSGFAGSSATTNAPATAEWDAFVFNFLFLSTLYCPSGGRRGSQYYS